jgi:hypothetical protein
MSHALKDGEQQAGNWIIWGGCLVTLFFWCPLNDPYNQINLLQLGEDEKASGNLSAARKVIPIINSFAANTPEAKKAQLDLGE